MPGAALTRVPTEIVVSAAPPDDEVYLQVGESSYTASADENGVAIFSDVLVANSGKVAVFASTSDGQSVEAEMRVIPGWVSITPPILAILIALLLRNVIPALLAGVWLGATALRSFSPSGIFGGLLDGFQIFVTAAVADEDHAAIILFSLMIGGMVGIITRNGGMASIVRMMVKRAKTAIGGQVSVWLMGVMIFFDDYSNTLVVGNTARPMTDALKIQIRLSQASVTAG